jgi:hypothetical protein
MRMMPRSLARVLALAALAGTTLASACGGDPSGRRDDVPDARDPNAPDARRDPDAPDGRPDDPSAACLAVADDETPTGTASPLDGSWIKIGPHDGLSAFCTPENGQYVQTRLGIDLGKFSMQDVSYAKGVDCRDSVPGGAIVRSTDGVVKACGPELTDVFGDKLTQLARVYRDQGVVTTDYILIRRDPSTADYDQIAINDFVSVNPWTNDTVSATYTVYRRAR